ncbi:ankyrin [Neocallimastix lanati (nom. inval.)]|nr:ankyrin [Neocallimastix sp. JGI-2020a]
MTKTEFEIFSETLLNQLKNENKDCLKTIENKSKLIEHYLNGQDLGYLKRFINEFNEAVTKSDVLIRACKKVNKKAVEWLLTMNIDPTIQDENGMTALMHSAEHVSTDFAVTNMVDNNGNNALFHATSLLKSRVNVNHLINDGKKSDEILVKEKNTDLNCINCVGMTPAMHLVKNARYREVESLVKSGKVNPDYVNKFGNSLVSVVTKNYAFTFRTLIDLGYYISAKYLIDNYKNLNLSIKNRYGISGSSFIGLIDKKSKPFSEHTTYENDIEYGKESVDNDCVIIQKQIVNSYPIKPEIKVLYPNAGAIINLGGNSYKKSDPKSFGALLTKNLTCGLGTY